MKTDEEIGREAAEITRANVFKAAKKKGVTLEETMLRLRQALNAKETKFFQYEGKVTDHRTVIAHGIRLNAVRVGLELLDAMPSKRHEISHSGSIERLTDEQIDSRIKELIDKEGVIEAP